MQQEWQTRVWRLEDAQRCWSELILEADRWPQRVAGPGSDGYVISADLYNRIFDSGIRFEGDEWAEFDEEPRARMTQPRLSIHTNPVSNRPSD